MEKTIMKTITLIILFFFLNMVIPFPNVVHAFSECERDIFDLSNIFLEDEFKILDSFYSPLKKPYDEFYTHFANDPVNVRNGNLYLPYTDFLIPCRGFPLEITRTYNSRSLDNGDFGFGWTFTYGIKVTKTKGMISIKESDGSSSNYFLSKERNPNVRDTLYLPVRGITRLLEKDNNGFIRISANGSKEYFDNTGRLIKKEDANGNILRIAYKHGYIDYVEDVGGRRLIFKYTTNGKISSIEDPIGRVYKYKYDTRDNLIEFFSPAGQKTQFSYDSYHNLVQLTYPNATSTTFVYDHEKDLLLKETGPGLRTTTYQYILEDKDANSHSTIVIDSLGHKTKYQYLTTMNGMTLNIINPQENKTTKEYDTYGNLVKTIKPDGKETLYFYDGLNRLTKIFAPSGESWEFSFEPGFCCTEWSKFRAPSGYHIIQQFDQHRNLTYITDSIGNSIETRYDDYGNPVEIINVMGKKTQNIYDKTGNLIFSKDFEGEINHFEYDTVGRLISIGYPTGSRMQIHYSHENLITKLVDGLGNQWEYQYDPMGNLISMKAPDGGVLRYFYDLLGNLIKTVDASGNEKTYTYDGNGNLASKTDENGNTMTFTYNSLNLLASIKDPMNNTILYTYTHGNKVANIQYHHALNVNYDYTSPAPANSIRMLINGEVYHSTKQNYLDQLTQYSNALDQSTEYIYSPDMVLEHIYYPDGTSVRFKKDIKLGKLTITGRKGISRYVEYDSSKRVLKETDALGNEMRYLYREGKMHQKISPDGKRTLFDHDRMGRLVQIKYPSSRAEQFKYDKLNRVISTKNGSSELEFDYDKQGRLIAVTDWNIKRKIEYGYDPAGNRTTLVLPSGSKVFYTYDSLNRITNIKLPNGRNTHYSYNSIGKVERLVHFNGIEHRYSYDDFGRLHRLAFYKRSGELVREFTYQYDRLGRITQKSEKNSGITKYEYDVPGHLMAVTSSEEQARYKYDQNGNRVEKLSVRGKNVYSYDEDDRLIKRDDTRYEYDQRGNRITKIKGMGKTFYEYNERNQLLKVIPPDTGPIYYGYDPFGRRISLEKSDTIRRYFYDGSRLITELIENGEIVNEFVYGAMPNEVLYQKSKEQDIFYHSDEIGNIIFSSDSNGNLVRDYDYGVFGEVKGKEDLPFFSFTGKVWDKDTGLYYFGKRDYDPEAGRFLQKDPNYNENLYVYVNNDPVNYIDPDGGAAAVAIPAGAVLILGLMVVIALEATPQVQEANKKIAEDLYNLAKKVGEGAKKVVDKALEKIPKKDPIPATPTPAPTPTQPLPLPKPPSTGTGSETTELTEEPKLPGDPTGFEQLPPEVDVIGAFFLLMRCWLQRRR